MSQVCTTATPLTRQNHRAERWTDWVLSLNTKSLASTKAVTMPVR